MGCRLRDDRVRCRGVFRRDGATRRHVRRLGWFRNIIGVDYVEDSPERAQAAALFALNRKSGHARCSVRCSAWELHTHQMLAASPGQPPELTRTRSNPKKA